ncbi:MAG: DUF1963 domain-containing protein, partial [Burkholderiaceae bacterium]|nr:DUF1963 domain-containing protein [Burkholderiaceae bacterium]
PTPWLPNAGSLLFFYDVEGQPWGFDPADRGKWAVLHLPDLAEPSVPGAKDDFTASTTIPFRYLDLRRIDSPPSDERLEKMENLKLTDPEFEVLQKVTESLFEQAPRHQVGGYPCPVQSDAMELESQLASHGLYCGDGTGYKDPRASALRPGAAEWRMLLQFDSDDGLGLMWGDVGRLYFWVQEPAARKGDFSNSWLVLQCS